MKMIFIITLTACLFYISQAKAHDTKQVLDDETARLIHQMTINITNEVFKNIPNILDSISAELRLQADKDYKCALQSDEYKNKDCNE